MIHRQRLTASLEGGFVVFLIGMRINKPLLVHKWWPVAIAMPRMLNELYRQPDLGFLHAEMWFSRTIFLLQYWRSTEQLMAYAASKTAAHLPAWQAFNRRIGTDGDVIGVAGDLADVIDVIHEIGVGDRVFGRLAVLVIGI